MNEGPMPSQLPPPLPEQYRRSSSFAKKAAIFCLWSPLLALLVTLAGTSVLQSHRSEFWSQMLISGASVLVVLAGLLFGLFGLSEMKRYGRKGIFGRAVTGVALNCVMLGVFAVVVVGSLTRARERAQANKQAMAKVHETV